MLRGRARPCKQRRGHLLARPGGTAPGTPADTNAGLRTVRAIRLAFRHEQGSRHGAPRGCSSQRCIARLTRLLPPPGGQSHCPLCGNERRVGQERHSRLTNDQSRRASWYRRIRASASARRIARAAVTRAEPRRRHCGSEAQRAWNPDWPYEHRQGGGDASCDFRAKHGPWSHRRDAPTTTKAGLRRPSRAGPSMAPPRLHGPHVRVAAFLAERSSAAGGPGVPTSSPTRPELAGAQAPRALPLRVGELK